MKYSAVQVIYDPMLACDHRSGIFLSRAVRDIQLLTDGERKTSQIRAPSPRPIDTGPIPKAKNRRVLSGGIAGVSRGRSP